ncbi:1053_t:CDS:2, partial [Funneliformis mosseae]
METIAYISLPEENVLNRYTTKELVTFLSNLNAKLDIDFNIFHVKKIDDKSLIKHQEGRTIGNSEKNFEKIITFANTGIKVESTHSD